MKNILKILFAVNSKVSRKAFVLSTTFLFLSMYVVNIILQKLYIPYNSNIILWIFYGYFFVSIWILSFLFIKRLKTIAISSYWFITPFIMHISIFAIGSSGRIQKSSFWLAEFLLLLYFITLYILLAFGIWREKSINTKVDL